MYTTTPGNLCIWLWEVTCAFSLRFGEQNLQIPYELLENSIEGSIKNKVSYLKSWQSSLHWSFVWSQKCLSTVSFSVPTDSVHTGVQVGLDCVFVLPAQIEK